MFPFDRTAFSRCGTDYTDKFSHFIEGGSYGGRCHARATNLLTGIVGSYQDTVPVVFLTGQCKRIETIRSVSVKIFVINNGGYGSIRRTQEGFYKGFFVGSTPDSGVSMPQPDGMIRSKALSEMAPNIGVSFEQALSEEKIAF